MTQVGQSLLVLGGARSGKSRFAQASAEALPGELLYVATAQAFDDEMASRIARHRDDRGPRWRTVEEPLDLPSVIAREAGPDRVILVDCLTLWASNLILADRDVRSATAALLATLHGQPHPIIFVSNEVGLGIVPDNALARRFRDDAGELNQAIAAAVDSVVLMTAGLPLTLKSAPRVPDGTHAGA